MGLFWEAEGCITKQEFPLIYQYEYIDINSILFSNYSLATCPTGRLKYD